MNTPSPKHPAGELFLFRLNKVAALSGRPLVKLCEGRHDISRREWRMIVTLAREGPLLSSQLAERARIEPARTSRAVTLLTEKGLVSRAPRPHDRRYVEIGLTTAGQAIYDTLYPTLLEMEQQLLAGLTEEDRQHLNRLMAHLEQTAQRLADRPDLPKADRRRRQR